MKRAIIISILLLAVSVVFAHAGPTKINRGKCVSDCVKSLNKTIKDKGFDAGNIANFPQKECSSWCKNEYSAENGYFWEDGVCNDDFIDTDPDCEGQQGGTSTLKSLFEFCAADVDCQSGNCAFLDGLNEVVCLPPGSGPF